jgi:pimeloyl-ACP methyl ester carboxylesterase
MLVPHVPPMWLEGRYGLEFLSLVRDPVWHGRGVQTGGGRPVLLIPGFLAGDGSLGPMTQWLRDLGYWTKSAGIRFNVDCSEAACRRIEERLECLAERHGRRVAIVGQSRGGVMARALAVNRPDLVSGIVTLGSPLRSMFGVHPLVAAQIAMVALLGSAGRSGMFGAGCLSGSCCERFRTAIRAPLPEDVRFVSIYSRTDGVVDWRGCLDPHADEHVEVSSSHCGMSVNAATYRAVGRALAAFAEHDGTAWAQTG